MKPQMPTIWQMCAQLHPCKFLLLVAQPPIQRLLTWQRRRRSRRRWSWLGHGLPTRACKEVVPAPSSNIDCKGLSTRSLQRCIKAFTSALPSLMYGKQKYDSGLSFVEIYTDPIYHLILWCVGADSEQTALLLRAGQWGCLSSVSLELASRRCQFS